MFMLRLNFQLHLETSNGDLLCKKKKKKSKFTLGPYLFTTVSLIICILEPQ